MDIVKVRELTDAELTEELVKQRRHLYDLRFQLATRQLTDYSQLTHARRTIARILTVQTEREAGDGRPQPAPRAERPAPARRRGPAKDDDSKAATTVATAKPQGRARRKRGEEE